MFISNDLECINRFCYRFPFLYVAFETPRPSGKEKTSSLYCTTRGETKFFVWPVANRRKTTSAVVIKRTNVRQSAGENLDAFIRRFTIGQ